MFKKFYCIVGICFKKEMFMNLGECVWIMRIFFNDFVIEYVKFFVDSVLFLLLCVIILVVVKKNKGCD